MDHFCPTDVQKEQSFGDRLKTPELQPVVKVVLEDSKVKCDQITY